MFRLRVFGAFFFLWVLHLSLRIPLLKNGLWLDEAAANLIILENSEFSQLRTGVSFLYQPVLDFILKKYFWYPLLGYSELSFRLVSIIYSSVNLALWFSGILCIFRKNRRFALAAAFLVGIWFCFLGGEIEQAGESRTYALVALSSSCWFFALYFFRRSLRLVPFLFFTLLFLNSHFFALPLVAFISILLGYDMFLNHQRKDALRFIGCIVLTMVITIVLNYPSIRDLFRSNVSSSIYSIQENPLWNAVYLALKDYWLLTQTFHWNYIGLPLLFSLFFLTFFVRNREEAYFARISLLVIFVFFPLFFFKTKLETEFPIKTRYLLPFLGFSLLPFLSLFELLRLVYPVNRLFLQIIMRFLVIFAFIYSIQFIDAGIFRKSYWIDSGYSLTKQFFQRQKSSAIPTFSLAYPCWCRDIPNLYWNYFEPSSKAADFLNAGTFDPQDCEQTNFTENSEMRNRFRDFLKQKKSVDVIVVDCSGNCKAGGAFSIKDSRACISLINEVRSEEYLLQSLRKLSFPGRL